MPTPAWSDWTFWQDSSTGMVPGISGNVDLDQFNGTLDDLHKFVAPPLSAPAVDPGPADDVAGGVGGGGPAPVMEAGCSVGGHASSSWAFVLVLLVLMRRRVNAA